MAGQCCSPGINAAKPHPENTCPRRQLVLPTKLSDTSNTAEPATLSYFTLGVVQDAVKDETCHKAIEFFQCKYVTQLRLAIRIPNLPSVLGSHSTIRLLLSLT